ncbi:hypothetical protein KY331_02900 [Candidatus Woesearchaeota archaeon]|nr:hypothetical protein [Candidatus Woesearchaeota archaeon]
MRIIKYCIILFLLIFVVGCAEKGVEPRQEMPAAVPGESQEIVSELPSPTTVKVDLTPSKEMVPNKLDIKRGTVVRFYNQETKFNHNLIIYPSNIKDPRKEDIITQSGNINPQGFWEYQFQKAGDYTIKDIYSGASGEITADVIAEILEKGKIIGTISVE